MKCKSVYNTYREKKKTWCDSVKNDMESLGLSQKYVQSRNNWRKIKGATG